jgi:hypothetical protein
MVAKKVNEHHLCMLVYFMCASHACTRLYDVYPGTTISGVLNSCCIRKLAVYAHFGLVYSANLQIV